jgi:hypothetical protein
LLRSATLDALRAARGTGDEKEPGQQVIDRILAGPPYAVTDLAEAALPYWLQAVRWFTSAIPDLPAPATIHRTLARRRIRSRLEEISGPGFRGRADELSTLAEWLAEPDPGAIAVTGIGGIGVGAGRETAGPAAGDDPAVARLRSSRPCPDDAVSVLTLLFEQLALQIDGFAPPSIDADTWQSALDALGTSLAPMLPAAPPLLVLDGFEVAQHAPRHEEIWGLLERFLDELPATRVIVSGRAPVTDVRLGQRPVRNLHLLGLARDDAAAWLRDYKVTKPAILDRVLEICARRTLILRLASAGCRPGGKVGELPKLGTARRGFLYRRILDRVIDFELKPVAQDILVLAGSGRHAPGRRGQSPEGRGACGRLRSAGPGDGTRRRQLRLLIASGLPVTVDAGAGVLQLRPEEVGQPLSGSSETADLKARPDDRSAAARWRLGPVGPVNVAELVYHASGWATSAARNVSGARTALRSSSTRRTSCPSGPARRGPGSVVVPPPPVTRVAPWRHGRARPRAGSGRCSPAGWRGASRTCSRTTRRRREPAHGLRRVDPVARRRPEGGAGEARRGGRR